MTLSFVMVLGILFIERTFNDNVDVFKIFRFIRSIHFFLGKTSPTPHLLAGWFSRPRTPGQSCSITIMSLRWCRCPFTSRAGSQICNGSKRKPSQAFWQNNRGMDRLHWPKCSTINSVLILNNRKWFCHGDKKIVENDNEAPIYERENLLVMNYKQFKKIWLKIERFIDPTGKIL